ncbi:predicted protein [Naegleria gruberi]|uniref:Predicted protein n=1 Tax=Naegleria gruberi TaxID=5762 RepID=D2UXW0_NAEGR|nr:uncharacterized protein NAEGRDRAFT_61259 [Naegleria gruberi]EFC50358.1 predicted protein [Naegleria gruberi]|eukprot:XP_002683102.1 predicted protein [Naegleria gruberi strain NEG-M]
MGSSLQQKISYLDKHVIEEQRNDSRKLYLENGTLKTKNQELATQIDDMVVIHCSERCQLYEQINKLEIELSELNTHKKKIEKQELLIEENVNLREKLLILENVSQSLRDENIHLQQTIHNHCNTNVLQNMNDTLNCDEVSNRVNEYVAERELLLEEIQHLNLEIGLRNRKIDSLLNENSILRQGKQLEQASLEKSMNLYEDLKNSVRVQTLSKHPTEIQKSPSFSIQTQTPNTVSNDVSCETERQQTISTSTQTDLFPNKQVEQEKPKLSLTPSKTNISPKIFSPKQSPKLLKLEKTSASKSRNKKEGASTEKSPYRFFLQGHDFK